MGLSFMVETGDSVVDDVGEIVGIGEGIVDELMLFEVAPASFDVVQLGGVFRLRSARLPSMSATNSSTFPLAPQPKHWKILRSSSILQDGWRSSWNGHSTDRS